MLHQNLQKNLKKKFKISSVTSNGGYYCLKCEKYVIKGMCGHKFFLNISGTEFRSFLKKKIIYSHADVSLQRILK